MTCQLESRKSFGTFRHFGRRRLGSAVSNALQHLQQGDAPCELDIEPEMACFTIDKARVVAQSLGKHQVLKGVPAFWERVQRAARLVQASRREGDVVAFWEWHAYDSGDIGWFEGDGGL